MGSNSKDRSTGSEVGGIAGAIIGSIFPGVGTMIGGAAGSALGGMIGSEFGPQQSSSSSGGGGMGGVLGGGGKGGKGGGGGSTGPGNAYAGNIAALAPQLSNMAPMIGNIAGLDANVGGDALSGGINQYTMGAAGQLTPAQQALTDFQFGQMNDATNSVFGSLGIGGSTMNTQGLNANRLQSLGQQEDIDFKNQQMGLNALGAGNQLLGTSLAGNMDLATLLTDAGSLYGAAGQNILGEQQLNLGGKNLGLQALGDLFGSGGGLGGSNPSGGGSGSGGSGGWLGQLFGSSGTGGSSGMLGNAGSWLSSLFSSGGTASTADAISQGLPILADTSTMI